MVKLELLKFTTRGGRTSVVKNADFTSEGERSNELVSEQDCVPLHSFYCISGFVGLKFSMEIYWPIRPTIWPPQSLLFTFHHCPIVCRRFDVGYETLRLQ